MRNETLTTSLVSKVANTVTIPSPLRARFRILENDYAEKLLSSATGQATADLIEQMDSALSDEDIAIENRDEFFELNVEELKEWYKEDFNEWKEWSKEEGEGFCENRLKERFEIGKGETYANESEYLNDIDYEYLHNIIVDVGWIDKEVKLKFPNNRQKEGLYSDWELPIDTKAKEYAHRFNILFAKFWEFTPHSNEPLPLFYVTEAPRGIIQFGYLIEDPFKLSSLCYVNHKGLGKSDDYPEEEANGALDLNDPASQFTLITFIVDHLYGDFDSMKAIQSFISSLSS